MSRRLGILLLAIMAFPQTALAQQIGTGQPVTVAVSNEDPEVRRERREERELSRDDDGYGPPPPVEDCEEADSGVISGEIIVCRRIRDQSEFRIRSEGRAEDDYARRTMNVGNPQAPDVAGPGIFRGKATISGLCLIPPCPPPIMPDIDFSELPEAPAGSDADRIGRGLPAIGNDGAAQTESRQPDFLTRELTGGLAAEPVSEPAANPTDETPEERPEN